MSAAPRPVRKSTFGWAGSVIGLLALYPLWHAEIFGVPRRMLPEYPVIRANANGAFVGGFVTGRDPFATYVQLALLGLCPLAFVLGLVALGRRERRLPALLALLYGLAFAWWMLLSVVVVYPTLAAATLSLAALQVYRRRASP